MRFADRTIFAVHKRLRNLIRQPRLFDDRMPSGRVRIRIERFRRWCGPALWQRLCTCEVKRIEPTGNVQRYRY